MMYKFGDVILIAFPFTNAIGAKKRPALVLYDAGDPDIVVARITSQPVCAADDIQLLDWQTAGLRLPSTVRLHKVATLEKSMINLVMGHISTADEQNVTAHLKKVASTL
jgi:mRNA interferase MazF